MKILIVGASTAGLAVAQRLRRLDESLEITVLDQLARPGFATCAWPYYIGRDIAQKDLLDTTDAEYLKLRYNIALKTESRVVNVDPKAKTVELADGTKENYDILVIATGRHPVDRWDDTELPSYHVFDVDHAEKLDNALTNGLSDMTILGCGPLALEMAEALRKRDVKVTLVSEDERLYPHLDPEFSRLIENTLIEEGVTLHLGRTIMATKGPEIVLDNRESFKTQAILLAGKVVPTIEFLKGQADLSASGALKVDRNFKTSLDDVYAVGDVIETTDRLTGEPVDWPLANPAARQGRFLADMLMDQREEGYPGVTRTSIVRVFNQVVGTVGALESELQAKGQKKGEDYLTAMAYTASRASYYPLGELYPGAEDITLKVIFDKEGKLLGASGIGSTRIDKTLDILSAFLQMGATVDDLQTFEPAYAPPFTKVKDAINVVGDIARGVLDGTTQKVTIDEWVQNEDRVLLDVREPEETMVKPLKGSSINIPLGTLRDRIGELDPDKAYLAVCAAGLRAYLGERQLKAKGFDVKALQGGMLSYNRYHQKPEQHEAAPQAADTNVKEEKGTVDVMENREHLDLRGLSCPGPIVQLSKAMQDAADGTQFDVIASDPGFSRDITAWADNTGNQVVLNETDGGNIHVVVQKGGGAVVESKAGGSGVKEKTMIVFSGELDRAIASFIIANGSAAMGNKVNMFFTFWGLSAIKKRKPPKVKKGFMEKMFDIMLPNDSTKLPLSKMNFMGLGPKMMRYVMKQKQIDSLEDLIRQAKEAGIRMTACQMSMDVMGITKEELIDGVEVGGVASMLNDNDRSNMNLFI